MTKVIKQRADRGIQRQISGYLRTFADPPLPLGPVIIKTALCAELGPSCTQLGPAEAATNCGTFCSSKQVARANHRQIQILASTRVSPSRGPRTNTTSGQLQSTLEQDPISFTSGTSKGRSWQAPDPAEVNSASQGQHLHSSSYTVVLVDAHSQPA